MMRLDKLPVYVFTLLAALALGGTQVSAQSAEEEALAAEGQAPIEGRDGRMNLVVENHNWLDATVYAISGSQQRRIGTVTALSSGTFTLPRDMSIPGRDFQIAVSPIGSRSVHYSPRILFDPGDRLEYRIENNLALSSFLIW